MEANRIRNKALLQGMAWTAAIAAALVCLKYPDLEPIPMVPLSVTALGWALVLFHALGKIQHAGIEGVALAGAATRDVIDSMAEVTGSQMSGARAEMLRADQLLGDAIDRLVLVFEKVTAQARAQCDLVQTQAQVTTTTAAATTAAAELREAAERVANEVNSAVMALQFRDMVGQKLGHVREKLVAAEEAMYEIRLASAQAAEAAAAGAADAPGPAELAVQVRERLQKLQAAEASTPVRQQLMHAGEVELF